MIQIADSDVAGIGSVGEPGKFRPFQEGQPDGLNLKWMKSPGFFQHEAGRFKARRISAFHCEQPCEA